MNLFFSKFKSLKNKIFFFFVVLLLLVQFLAFWAISMAIEDQEEHRLKSELSSASTIFQTIFSTSDLTLNNFNQISNKILAENFLDDTRSFLVVLENFRRRVDADLAMSIDMNGLIKAQIIRSRLANGKTKQKIGEQQGTQFPFPLEVLSIKDEIKFYQIQNQIYQFSISEVHVGIETIGWVGLGNRIDDSLAAEFF